MSNFNQAMRHTIKWEGGYVDHPSDPGGATNYGISLRFLLGLGYIKSFDYDADGDIDAIDIRELQEEHAKELYRKHFWNPKYEKVEIDGLATKLFDFGVNMGRLTAVKLLQKVVGAKEDGLFGEQTLKAVNLYRTGCLVRMLEDEAARFYYELASRRSKSRKFLYGWLRRCYDRPK